MFEHPTLEIIGSVREVVLGMGGDGMDFNGLDFAFEFEFVENPASARNATEGEVPLD